MFLDFFFFCLSVASAVFKAFWLFWLPKLSVCRRGRDSPGVIFWHPNRPFVRRFAHFHKFSQNCSNLTKIVHFFKKKSKFFQFCPNHLTCSVFIFFILAHFASFYVTLLALRFAEIHFVVVYVTILAIRLCNFHFEVGWPPFSMYSLPKARVSGGSSHPFGAESR